jgi:hypothetical protein
MTNLPQLRGTVVAEAALTDDSQLARHAPRVKSPAMPEQKSVEPKRAAPSGSSAKPSKVNVVVIGGLVALVAVAIAYGVGRMQMTPKINSAETAASSAAAGVRSAQAQVTAEHAKVLELEARRRLDLALLALDDRNFGIAQSDLKAAARLLGDAHAAPDGDLGKLKAQIEKVNVTVTQDLSAQRGQLVSLIQRFDQIVPPPAK